MYIQESPRLPCKANLKVPLKDIQNPADLLGQELETTSHRTITLKALCGQNSLHEQEKVTRQSKKGHN